MDLSKFYVVTMISNPKRFESRYKLYREFEKHMHHSGAQLYTIEVAYGDRPHSITESGNPKHIQLNSWHEVWHKENALNIAISRLPTDWEYVAWIDADVHFVRQDWVAETVHQLQHHHIVQMFSIAQDLGPHPMLEPINSFTGFAYCYVNGMEVPSHIIGSGGEKKKWGGYWHPGFAWAARREAIEYLGGLLDTGILGAGDNHMAHSLIGRGEFTLAPGVSEGYKRAVMQWQNRAERYIRRDIGYVPGTIMHSWHGKKKDRKYYDRWKILVEHGFDPYHDLKRDAFGLWQLEDHGDIRSIKLRDQMRAYFAQRNEDSVDIG